MLIYHSKFSVMKKKGGISKKAIKREYHVNVRIMRSEEFIIREKASKAGLTLSAYMREIAIHGEVRAKFNKEQWQMLRQLVAVSNDLHQLSGIARQEGTLKAVLHFEAYRDRVDELLNRLKYVQQDICSRIFP
jgi:hypothetical protein